MVTGVSSGVVTPGSMSRYADKNMKVVESVRARAPISLLMNGSLSSYGRKEASMSPKPTLSQPLTQKDESPMD